jgi:fatty-acyl-CoA synthase
VVVLEHFDPVVALQAIEEHGVTHSQWVPTHFVRMLRLPEQVRRRYDVSRQRYVVHAAAPCPVEVKRAMIEWWGPVLQEYYSSTEANGVCTINSAEWLAKPGSVGTAKLGVLRICDDAGAEVPVGVDGLVYFERDEVPFGYHKDPDKTRSVQHPDHPTWTTCGDIGHVDDDGFLFLTDRKAFMIISGGVNIYPQEIEDSLILHPDVFDVAVIGVPDAEMGESVLAVVQPAAGVVPGDEVAERLLAHVRGRLAGYKVPRRVEFVEELPRTATGKLVKGRLRNRFAPVDPFTSRTH